MDRPIVAAINIGSLRFIYKTIREYWELTGRFELTQIYDEAKLCLHNLLRLHKIVKGLRMNEHDIKKIFELVKYNQLELLQWKVQYLTNEVNMLEFQKEKATSDILKLNSAINQLESSLPQNQGTRSYDNPGSLYPIIDPQPNTNWYSIFLIRMNDYQWHKFSPC